MTFHCGPDDGGIDLARLQSAGLYDPAAPDADHVRQVLLWMRELGLETDQIIEAAKTESLHDLVASVHLREVPEFTMVEAADQLNMSVEDFDHLRRTTGLAPRDLDRPVFSKTEVGAFLAIQQGKSMFTLDEANHFARVLGSSLARIADAAVSLFLIDVEGPVRDAGGTDFDVAKLNIEAANAADSVGAALEPLFRLHLEDAVMRSRESRAPGDDVHISRMAVGFIDLVGFTAFSEHVPAAELGLLVRTFEDRAYDVVAEHGGRVVKLIGDEVMFVAVDAQVACDTARALISAFRADNVTPRGGLAYGELLTRGGDYYGPIVNLASRIGDLAVPCELLATPAVAERCPDVAFGPAGRRMLKGFSDPIELVSLDC